MSDKIKKWLIAAGILIAAGAVIVAIANRLGTYEVSGTGILKNFSLDLANPGNVRIGWESGSGSRTEKKESYVFTKEETDAVSKMEVGWNAGVLTVEEWNGDHIEAEVEYEGNDSAPEIVIKDGTLFITSRVQTATIHIGIHTDSFEGTKAVVRLPAGKKFEKIEAEMNAGIMRLDDQTAVQELDIRLNAGELFFKNAVVSGKTEIEVNAGKADLGGTFSGKVDAEVNAGLLELENQVPVSETGVEISVHAGAAEFNGRSIAGFGSYENENKDAANSFAAEVNAGALKAKYAE